MGVRVDSVSQTASWVNKMIANCTKGFSVLFSLVAMTCLLMGSGCSANTPHVVPVTGKVSYNGKPLNNGTIMLIPDGEGFGATGIIQPDGTFTLTSFKKGDGAAPGNYKVTVEVFPDEAETGVAVGLPGAEFGEGQKPPVPVKYSSSATTPLRAIVNDGETELDLELTD